jgi:uncharacterized phage infection (PIP) family protein YhgE
MSTKGALLDAAVREAGRLDLSPDQTSELHGRIAVMSYWLSQTVADAYRAFANAEGNRKAHMARHVITMQATGASNAKAQATVEGSDEYQGLRMAEVEAECEYIRWKQTAQGVQNVLSSLQMRIAMLRDERKWTATTPAVR